MSKSLAFVLPLPSHRLTYTVALGVFLCGLISHNANAKVTLQKRPLTPPTEVRAIGSASRIILTWNSVVGATSYQVFCSSSATTFPQKPIATTRETKLTVTSRSTAARLYFVVKANNLKSESAFSRPTVFELQKILPKQDAPSQPTKKQLPASPVAPIASAPDFAQPATGYYRLKMKGQSNFSLGVLNFGTANGTLVVADNTAQTRNQRWKLDQQSDGSYKIRAYSGQTSNEVLDLANGLAQAGNKIALWEDNTNPAQLWYFQEVGDSYFRILPKNVNLSMDLTLQVKETVQGASLSLATYNGSDTQLFRLEDFGDVQLRAGIYRIARRGHPELSLGAPKDSPDSAASLLPTSDAANQKWRLDPLPDGSYKVTVFTGQDNDLSLDLVNGETINGNRVRVWAQNGSPAQQWYFKEIGGGAYRILSKKSGADSEQTVEVVDSTEAKAGSGLRLFPYGGTDNQVFVLQELETGKK